MRTLRLAVAVIALLVILSAALCVTSVVLLSSALMLRRGARLFLELWRQEGSATPVLLIAVPILFVAGGGVFALAVRRYGRFVREREFARPDDPWPVGERAWGTGLGPYTSNDVPSPPVTWSAVLIAIVGLASAAAVASLVIVATLSLEAVILGGPRLFWKLSAVLAEPLRDSYATVIVSVLVGCIAGIPAGMFLWYRLASFGLRMTTQELLDLFGGPK